MIGAIIGDIVGSAYEFNNINTTKFPLFSERSCFTDDTVMTCAVAKVLNNCGGIVDYIHSQDVVKTFQNIGRRYPNAGYGAKFIHWMFSDNLLPYNSCGNGSAMRIAPAGFYAHSLDEAKYLARLFSEVSHNHPEGIKGAECTAVCIFLARNQWKKHEIREYIKENYYPLDKTCDDYRSEQAGQHGKEICQVSVPQAITCFMESRDYEDCIRLCVSIGGDSDTIAAIAGGIAEAYYGVPDEIWEEAKKYLPEDLLEIAETFEANQLQEHTGGSIRGSSYEAFLIYDEDEEKRKAFKAWLKIHGFSFFARGGSMGPAPWLYINLSTMKYTAGVYGCKYLNAICEHAITGAEFREIYNIYKKYKGLGTLKFGGRNMISKLDEAITFAAKAHSGACRKGTDTPYIIHPMEVMKIVCGLTDDEEVRVAAVLHDTVEDTGTKISEIKCVFGERVAELVGAESENKREGTPETDTWLIRKQETIDHLGKVSRDARLICLGDKLANLRDIARDWRKLGDGLWERFNAPEDKKTNIGWYYGSIGKKIKADFDGTAEFEEYKELMKEVFNVDY